MDVNAVSIQQANLHQIDHQQAILGLTQAYAGDAMGAGEALSAEVLERLIPGLQATPTTLVFLAYIENVPVGIATCFTGFSTFLAKPLINIHDLAVLPKYRGQGIGGKLLAAVEAKGIELGCGKLTLEVQSENLTAQGIYTRAGFNNGKRGELSGKVFFFAKYLSCIAYLVLCVFSLTVVADDAMTARKSSIDLPASIRLLGVQPKAAVDRTYYWIPAFSRIRTRLDREFTSLTDVQREAITHEQVVAEQEISKLVSSTARPWSSSDAIEIYRRIVRLAYLGNRESRFVRDVTSSILPERTDKSFIAIQNRVPIVHRTMRWPIGTYLKVESPHFEVTTQGTAEIAERIAILAEQTHAVWQQSFLPAWCEPKMLESALLDGKSLPVPPSQLSNHRMQITLFKNRDQYVRGLREIQPNIGISTGFYHPGSATVFCYWDESVSANVLKHEITHQLFSEASRWEPLAVDSMQKNFWIIEGVALYMESMLIDPAVGCDRVTLGGWDSPRLQPARYRRLHDEFWIPWNEFTRGTAKTFQQGESVGQHYSQAAGLTHFGMDHSLESRSPLIDFACDAYQDETDARAMLFSDDDDKIRSQYDLFLLSAGKLSRNLPPRPGRKDIVLSRTDVDSEMMLNWPTTASVKLDWLDLSFTKVDDSLWIDAAIGRWDARRLNVEGTSVSDASVPAIAAINRLEELDLSACKVSDAGLEPLRGHRSLRKLWLTGTNVSDSVIDLLASLSRLEEVELTGTRVTDQGRQELARRIPRLRRK